MSNRSGPAPKINLFFGLITKQLIFGDDGSLYLKRYKFPRRRRLHVFYRGDADPDPHDHPFSFTTWPLVPYLEEVYTPENGTTLNYVAAGKSTYRAATHCHRVIGPAILSHMRDDGSVFYFDYTTLEGTDKPPFLTRLAWWMFGEGTIVTLVKTSPSERKWGFWVKRGNGRIWINWREYLFGDRKTWIE